jgi:hypothetical protein
MRTILVLLMMLLGSMPVSAQVRDFKSFAKDLVDLEGLSRLDSAPAKMASTYDRSGGNDDGFNPAWLKDGVYTFLDLRGPGVIRRFYAGKPGGHLRIFIDDNPKPIVDMPCEEFFAGRHEPFVRPMVGPMGGSNYSFFPIPFAKSIKMQTTAERPKDAVGNFLPWEYGVYFQVTYQIFPAGARVRSLQLPLAAEEQTAWRRVQETWWNLGQDPKPASPDQLTVSKQVRIEPGKRAEVVRLTGPGVIDRFYLKIDPADSALLRSTLLKMHWDNEEKDSVDCPVGDFFGNGFYQVPFKSMPIGLTEEGYYSYFSMPFNQLARISLANESTDRRLSVDVKVVYRRTADMPSNKGYFNAKWRREEVVAVDEYDQNNTGEYNYRFLDVHGRGRFIGFNLNVFNRYPYWWGEGDPMIFVDNEVWPPSIHGTGTEETFNDGWGFHQYIHAVGADKDKKERNVIPVSGVLVGGDEDPLHWFGGNAIFTFNITDSVPFRERILATIEHGYGTNQLTNDYSSTAYWYAAPGSRDFFLMRPASERTTIPQAEWSARREAAIQQLRPLLAAARDDITRLSKSSGRIVQYSLLLVTVVLDFSDKLGLPAEDRDRLRKQCQALSGDKEERAREAENMLVELSDKLGTKAEPRGMN